MYSQFGQIVTTNKGGYIHFHYLVVVEYAVGEWIEAGTIITGQLEVTYSVSRRAQSNMIGAEMCERLLDCSDLTA